LARTQGEQVGQYGKGSLKEIEGAPGRWRYRVRIDGYQGERKSPASQSLSKAQANRWAKAIDAELRNGTHPVPTQSARGLTFGDVLDEWIAHGRTPRGKPWAVKTARENRRSVERYLRPALGHIDASALSVADLEAAYGMWTAGRHKLEDASARRIASNGSTAMSLALRRGWVTSNPFASAVAPAAPSKTSTRCPTRAEVDKLAKASGVYGHDMTAAVALARFAAARCQDISALQWRDLDLKEGTVHIHKAATLLDDGRVVIKATKTGESATVLVRNGNLEELRTALGTPGMPTTYVFGGTSTPVNPSIITDRFAQVRELASVDDVTMTGVRHYWVTQMRAAGVPAHTVAKLGRWRSTAMIDRIYTHSTVAGEEMAASVDL
jgi:integrase